MTREIIMDTDTSISYDYPNQQFCVTNKGTTVYRHASLEDTTAKLQADTQQALTVLQVVAPTLKDVDNKAVTVNRLISELIQALEPLHTLSCTLADNGSYIATIQLNAYSNNPLTLNANKHRIYIMNTNIGFDLDLNLDEKHIILTFIDYYKRHLGLSISYDDFNAIYLLMTSYYTPQCYNQITNTTPLKYTNVFGTTNYSEPTRTTYLCTSNPNSQYTNNTLYHIQDINSNKVFTIVEPITDNIHVGDSIIVANATTVVSEDNSYSANGTYTITAIQPPYIKVKEKLTTFTTTLNTLYLEQPILSISSASRETRKLTLTNTVPDSILIGDTIYIEDTTRTVDYQEVSIDGTYTVKTVTGSDLTVEEEIPTNYTHTTVYGTCSKRVELGQVLSIKDNKITLTNKELPTLTNLKVILEDNQYTVVSNTSNTITVEEEIGNYTPNYAELQVPVPSAEIKIERGEDTLIVDNPTQCNSYMEKVAKDIIPPDSVYDNIGQAVPTSIDVPDCTVSTCEVKGIYSSIYSDS